MNKHKYALRYDIVTENDPNGYTKEEREDKGLCDSFMFFSIIEPDDGSYSQAVFSFKGKENRELNDDEKFKAWLMLGLSLNDDGNLKGWKAQHVAGHATIIREMFTHKDGCP